jgi:hypothetical protein
MTVAAPDTATADTAAEPGIAAVVDTPEVGALPPAAGVAGPEAARAVHSPAAPPPRFVPPGPRGRRNRGIRCKTEELRARIADIST